MHQPAWVFWLFVPSLSLDREQICMPDTLLQPNPSVATESSTIARSFYQQWYAQNTPTSYADNQLWHRYVQQLHTLIAALPTAQPRGLEVGSGGGQLQHSLERYVGTDIAVSAGRFMVQPFCAASATALPFPNQTFDLVWSIWTLEHVIDPESMLREMQRVTRPGGYIFLCAAWCVPDWVTRGYHLGVWQPGTLAALLLRLSVYPRRWFGWPGVLLGRIYALLFRQGKHPLFYRFLLPSYTTYYDTDADACITVDPASVILWFQAHGVECISHSDWKAILRARHNEPLIFRVPEIMK